MKTIKLLSITMGLMISTNALAEATLQDKVVAQGAAIGACAAKKAGDKEVSNSVTIISRHFNELNKEIELRKKKHGSLDARDQQQLREMMKKDLRFAKRVSKKGLEGMNTATKETVGGLISRAEDKLQSGDTLAAVELVSTISQQLNKCN